MPYFLLFALEIILLWRLARAVNSRFFGLLPTPVYILLFLPGTFLHELSHYIAAKLLFVRVGKFSLRPEKRETEIVLGSVAIEKTNIVKRLIIGAAPVIVGLFLIIGIVYLVVTRELTSDWRVVAFLSYFIFVVGNTMFSSKKDMEGAWKVIIFSLVIGVILYLLGLRVYFDADVEVLKIAGLYLLPVIAIDAGILCVLFLARR